MVGLIESIHINLLRQPFQDSPKLLAYVEANFSGDRNAPLRRQLVEATDESAFTLRQWVESLHILQSWLGARGLEMPLADQISYVGCAADSAGSGASLSHLPTLLAELLEIYGCDRAVKRV